MKPSFDVKGGGGGEQLWCICRMPANGKFMIGCDGCDEWYHGACINISEQESENIVKYYCMKCRKRNSDNKTIYKKSWLEKRRREKEHGSHRRDDHRDKTLGSSKKRQRHDSDNSDHRRHDHRERGHSSDRKQHGGESRKSSSGSHHHLHAAKKQRIIPNLTDSEDEVDKGNPGAATKLPSDSTPTDNGSTLGCTSSRKEHPVAIGFQDSRKRSDAEIKSKIVLTTVSKKEVLAGGSLTAQTGVVKNNGNFASQGQKVSGSQQSNRENSSIVAASESMEKGCGNCPACRMKENCGVCPVCIKAFTLGIYRGTCRKRICSGTIVTQPAPPLAGRRDSSGAVTGPPSAHPPASHTPVRQRHRQLDNDLWGSGDDQEDGVDIDEPTTLPRFQGNTRRGDHSFGLQESSDEDGSLLEDMKRSRGRHNRTKDRKEKRPQCMGPDCVYPSVKGSKYCSDQCGLALATRCNENVTYSHHCDTVSSCSSASGQSITDLPHSLNVPLTAPYLLPPSIQPITDLSSPLSTQSMIDLLPATSVHSITDFPQPMSDFPSPLLVQSMTELPLSLTMQSMTHLPAPYIPTTSQQNPPISYHQSSNVVNLLPMPTPSCPQSYTALRLSHSGVQRLSNSANNNLSILGSNKRALSRLAPALPGITPRRRSRQTRNRRSRQMLSKMTSASLLPLATQLVSDKSQLLKYWPRRGYKDTVLEELINSLDQTEVPYTLEYGDHTYCKHHSVYSAKFAPQFEDNEQAPNCSPYDDLTDVDKENFINPSQWAFSPSSSRVISDSTLSYSARFSSSQLPTKPSSNAFPHLLPDIQQQLIDSAKAHTTPDPRLLMSYANGQCSLFKTQSGANNFLLLSASALNSNPQIHSFHSQHVPTTASVMVPLNSCSNVPDFSPLSSVPSVPPQVPVIDLTEDTESEDVLNDFNLGHWLNLELPSNDNGINGSSNSIIPHSSTHPGSVSDETFASTPNTNFMSQDAQFDSYSDVFDLGPLSNDSSADNILNDFCIDNETDREKTINLNWPDESLFLNMV